MFNPTVSEIEKLSPDQLFDNFDELNSFELHPQDLEFQYYEVIPMSLIQMNLTDVFDALVSIDVGSLVEIENLTSPKKDIDQLAKLNVPSENKNVPKATPSTNPKTYDEIKVTNYLLYLYRFIVLMCSFCQNLTF